MTMAVPVSWQPGKHPARGDVCVLQQLQRHEAVIVRGLRVVEDLPHLRQVTRTQQMRHVDHGLAGQQLERLRLETLENQDGPWKSSRSRRGRP